MTSTAPGTPLSQPASVRDRWTALEEGQHEERQELKRKARREPAALDHHPVESRKPRKAKDTQ